MSFIGLCLIGLESQVAFGNRHCEETLLYLSRSIVRQSAFFPEPCISFYDQYEWSRLPENRNEIGSD